MAGRADGARLRALQAGRGEMERAAGGRDVLRVSIADHPRAASLPVRSVPAAPAVDGRGRLRAHRAGRLAPADLDGVLAALA